LRHNCDDCGKGFLRPSLLNRHKCQAKSQQEVIVIDDSEDAEPELDPNKDGAGAGMMNMGNTCFLNSTLQVLFHIPAVKHYLCVVARGHGAGCTGLLCTICILAFTLRQSLASNVIEPDMLYNHICLSAAISFTATRRTPTSSLDI